jgi:hypothetical protein
VAWVYGESHALDLPLYLHRARHFTLKTLLPNSSNSTPLGSLHRQTTAKTAPQHGLTPGSPTVTGNPAAPLVLSPPNIIRNSGIPMVSSGAIRCAMLPHGLKLLV